MLSLSSYKSWNVFSVQYFVLPGDERGESDDEILSDDESDDEDDIPYNPKNLPLGWDGKVKIY